MDMMTIEGKLTEFLSIYNNNGNVVIYISSSDVRDYTDDVQTLLEAHHGQNLTLDDILEGLDIAVVIEKDEAIESLKNLTKEIEGWRKR